MMGASFRQGLGLGVTSKALEAWLLELLRARFMGVQICTPQALKPQ